MDAKGDVSKAIKIVLQIIGVCIIINVLFLLYATDHEEREMDWVEKL